MVKYDWEAVKKDYEKSMDSFAKQAKRHGIRNPAYLRRKAKMEGWISPREVDRGARNIAKERNKEIMEKAADHYLQEYEKRREKVIEICDKALKDFAKEQKAGERTPKDFHELVKAASLLKDVCGIKEDAGPKLGLNINLLASAAPEIIEV